MKPHSFTLLLVALTALTTLPNVASAQAPAGKSSAQMHPAKIEIKFVEASPDKGGASPQTSPAELLAALTKDGAKMTEMTLQTTLIQDVPFSTAQMELIPFVTTENGKPQTNYVPVTNSFSATPHFNPDGTIRLNLTLQRSEVQKSDTPSNGLPNVVSQSTSTIRTLVGGQPIVLGGFVTGGKPDSAHAAPVGGTQLLVFITATVLLDNAKKP